MAHLSSSPAHKDFTAVTCTLVISALSATAPSYSALVASTETSRALGCRGSATKRLLPANRRITTASTCLPHARLVYSPRKEPHTRCPLGRRCCLERQGPHSPKSVSYNAQILSTSSRSSSQSVSSRISSAFSSTAGHGADKSGLRCEPRWPQRSMSPRHPPHHTPRGIGM